MGDGRLGLKESLGDFIYLCDLGIHALTQALFERCRVIVVAFVGPGFALVAVGEADLVRRTLNDFRKSGRQRESTAALIRSFSMMAALKRQLPTADQSCVADATGATDHHEASGTHITIMY